MNMPWQRAITGLCVSRTLRDDPAHVASGAWESPDGKYRWLLWRTITWALLDTPPPFGFVMLNPSTADATHDDPTIRRCVGFARREKAGGIVVVNLSPLRSTDPRALRTQHMIDDNNARAIATMRAVCERVVLAWGASVPAWLRPREEDLRTFVTGAAYCLGRTRGGEPRHPLMVPGYQPIEVFTVALP